MTNTSSTSPTNPPIGGTASNPDLDWTPPMKGCFRRDFRLAEWMGGPVSPSFATWAVPQLERGFSDAVEDRFSTGLALPGHVVVNGWMFTTDPKPASMARALLRHPREMVGFSVAMATMASHPERGERVMAEPAFDLYQSETYPAHCARVDVAAEAVSTATPRELIGIVDELTHSTGTLMFGMVQTMGFAGKAEYALASFYTDHLRPTRGGSHLELLAGLVDPQPLPAHAVVSLDWIAPTHAELQQAGGEPRSVAGLRERRLAAEEECRDLLADDARRLRAFDASLAIAQRWIPVREQLASEFTLAWPTLRVALGRLGDHLAALGVIDRPNDIHYFERSEIERAVDGDRSSRADVITARRAAREEAALLSVPLGIGKPAGPWRKMDTYLSVFRSPGPGTTTPLVLGIPSSPGLATGRVRVVRDVDGFDDFEEGEILVAPVTAPAWNPLFMLASAVVTDTGSPFAHASVVAREYGIPAIVGTGDATTRLKTGQMVTVDAIRGAVDLA